VAEPVYRRLNPRTIAVELVRLAGRFAFLFVVVLFTRDSGADFLFEAFSGLVVVSAVARYLSFSYAIHEGHLLIKSGIVTRTNRTIPLSKIQNINIKKSVVHRVFGLVDLEIETAAGAEAEASLSALSVDEANALKVELTRGVHREIGLEQEPETVRGRTVYRINSKELFLAGATENRALAIVGAVFGGSFLFQDRLEGFLRGIVPNLGSSWVSVVVLIVIVLVIGWVVSIFSAVVSYGNFEVTLEGGKLRRHYGLLNQIESVVPLPRVQSVRTSETLLQRLLHLCKLYVETAGHFQKEDLGGSSMICPLLETDRLTDIVMTVLPGRPVNAVKWRRVSPRTVRVYFQVSMWVYLVLVSSAALYFGWVAFWALAPLAHWALFTGWVHYRTTGWDDKPTFLAARHGVFSRRTMYVPVEKIQSTALRQSPLQRRLGLASVVVNTASVGLGGTCTVGDLDLKDADPLARSLHRRSADAVRATGEVL
jgi:putative membrane protein